MAPSEFPYLLTAIRLLAPLLLLRWPLAGILLCIAGDLLDWKFFPFHTESDYVFYQHWDKAMDLWYWLFILPVIWRWSNRPAKQFTLFLFGYRMVGMLLFFLTGSRATLVVFPNLFENFFIFYLLYMKIFKRTELSTTWPFLLAVVITLFVPKFLHEYAIHYLIHQPWEFYNVGRWLGLEGIIQEYTNYFVWGGILYVVPFAALLLWVRWYKNTAFTAPLQ